MPKTKSTNVQPANDGITDEQQQAAQQRYEATSHAMTVMNDNAKAMALQVGYEGSMTVGAIEDEIRFYQRVTVEALLETGKRLLVLKELTPHGEFAQRLEMLGFESTKAQRYMKAAASTAKNSNLQLLSGQAKNISAFMEIIMSDDEVIEDLTKMDDIDRMSASELRKLTRELKDKSAATTKLLQQKDDKINKLSLSKSKVALTDWPAAFEPIMGQASAAHRALEKAFSDIDIIALDGVKVIPEPGEEAGLNKAFEALACQLRDTLAMAQAQLEKTTQAFHKTVGMFVPADLAE